MFSQHITNPAIEKLHKAGLHFVLCRAKDEGDRKAKAAIIPRWQHHPATLEAVLKHRAEGGLLGFVPGRSGLLVIDVDKFPGDDKDASALVARLGIAPLAIVQTKRGLHLYLRKDGGEIGNRAWALDGFAGDIRADHGYVIGWKLDQLAAALDRLPDAIPTADSIFPKPTKGKTKAAAIGYTKGHRSDTLNARVYSATLRGEPVAPHRAEALESGLPAAKVDDIIKRAVEAGRAKTADAFPRKDADALEAALQTLGIEIRYNLRAMRAEFKKTASEWEKTDDLSSADLRREIAEKFLYSGHRGPAALRFGPDSWGEHLNALLHHRRVDPFRDWLESLPAWDEKKRLVNILQECLGAADGPLTRWASFYLCLGAVQRTYEPGCLLREIPILIGPQRAGKSQLLSNLLPAQFPEWFSDSVNVSDDVQKRVEGLLGRVIVELSELTGFRRAELESLKAFISRRDDGATRLAYRRDPETALRRCILVGTSNDAECLPNDPSGNTRYVPIQCVAGTHVEPYLAERRNQLWAEGLTLYRQGERANLPRNLMGLQAEHGERHRRKDQIVEDAVAGIDTTCAPYTMRELCQKTTPPTNSTDRRAVSRLSDALRLTGWTKKHERIADGKRAYLWRPSD